MSCLPIGTASTEPSHLNPPPMRISLSVLLASLLTLVAPLPARSFEGCDISMATGAHTRCLIKALSAMDRELNRALKQVAKEAEGVPSEMFRTLWRDNLTSFYNTSPDPLQQAKRFRAERRRICGLRQVDRVPGDRLRHRHHPMRAGPHPNPAGAAAAVTFTRIRCGYEPQI